MNDPESVLVYGLEGDTTATTGQKVNPNTDTSPKKKVILMLVVNP